MVLLIVENEARSEGKGETYNVYVGNNTKKIFYNNTLPDFLKVKLAILK